MGIEVSVREAEGFLEVCLSGTLDRVLFSELGHAIESISHAGDVTVIDLTQVGLAEGARAASEAPVVDLRSGRVLIACPDDAITQRLKAWELSWIDGFYPSPEAARAAVDKLRSAPAEGAIDSETPEPGPGGARARTVSIITDSSACIPAAVRDALGIMEVPIQLHVGDATLTDDEPAAREAVYVALGRGEVVKSSTPSPAQFLSAIEGAAGSSVLVVTPAVEFSAMVQAATVVVSEATKDVVVHDSRTAAGGQALVVMAAATAARDGADSSEVLQAARSASQRCRLLALVGGLDQIAVSGRVGAETLEKAEGRAEGSIFTMQDGEIEVLTTGPMPASGVTAVLDCWAAQGRSHPGETVVFHAGRGAEAQELAEKTGATLLTEFSPAMAVHTGPSVLGLAWLTPGSGVTPPPKTRSGFDGHVGGGRAGGIR